MPIKDLNILKKRRLLRKIDECFTLIDRGNLKIADTLETLEPVVTTSEMTAIYTMLKQIMHKQCQMYGIMISETGKGGKREAK